MKGRLYDATIGRFISADPHVQAPGDTQSYNRYTYVKNNPLSYTDPSGYFFRGLFRAVRKFIRTYGRTILAIAAGVVTGGLAMGAVLGQGFVFSLGAVSAGYSTATVFAAAVAGGAAGGFASGLIMTGSLSGAAKGAAFGALSAGLAFGIGHGAGGNSLFGGKAGTAIAHGVAQGTVSVLRGGKFKSGFAGGFFGHMSSGLTRGIKGVSSAAVAARTAASAMIGGTISKLAGGKFANGAVSAAFTHLFNAEGDIRHIKRYGYKRGKGWFFQAGLTSSASEIVASATDFGFYVGVDKYGNIVNGRYETLLWGAGTGVGVDGGLHLGFSNNLPTDAISGNTISAAGGLDTPFLDVMIGFEKPITGNYSGEIYNLSITLGFEPSVGIVGGGIGGITNTWTQEQ